jgi:DNA-binding SARP family transcriptional activator
MTPAAVKPGRRRFGGGQTIRLLHLLASVAIVVFLAVLPPALPDFGPSIATPLTTSTLVQLGLLLLWIVCLLLALVLLRAALFPTRLLRPPPPWAARPAPRRPHRVPQLVRGEAPAPRLVVPRREGSAAQTLVDEQGPTDAATGTQRIVARVVLLGPVAIEGVRRPRRATTVELLAYLALHEQGASRDELLEAMWPGEDPRRTRPRLWQGVSEARRLLGDAFERDGDRYKLARTHVAVDVDELDRLLAAIDGAASPKATIRTVERAVALWRAAPFAGSDFAWTDGHVHRLEASLNNLAERGGRTRLALGDARGALDLAERGLALDSLNETFVRLALEAEAALGQRERVTERYEQFSELLDRTLGLQPRRETRATYRRLLGPGPLGAEAQRD